MPNKTKRTLRPALAIEKEVKRDEISTGLNVGVEKLEGKTTARQPIDNKDALDLYEKCWGECDDVYIDENGEVQYRDSDD